MPAGDDRRRLYLDEREGLIRALEALEARPHPEGRVFTDGAALRDTGASSMESLRLRIRELTGLIERIESGEA